MMLSQIDIILALLVFASIALFFYFHIEFILRIGLFFAGLNVIYSTFYGILSYE